MDVKLRQGMIERRTGHKDIWDCVNVTGESI